MSKFKHIMLNKVFSGDGVIPHRRSQSASVEYGVFRIAHEQVKFLHRRLNDLRVTVFTVSRDQKSPDVRRRYARTVFVAGFFIFGFLGYTQNSETDFFKTVLSRSSFSIFL